MAGPHWCAMLRVGDTVEVTRTTGPAFSVIAQVVEITPRQIIVRTYQRQWKFWKHDGRDAMPHPLYGHCELR